MHHAKLPLSRSGMFVTYLRILFTQFQQFFPKQLVCFQ
jgi:hypothetical protein